MLMIFVALAVFGLILGSFVNALVWRIHEQAEELDKKKPSQKRLKSLSISKGHSMCPHCKHQLSALDLVPVFSWLFLVGKCRYCKKPISVQYPIVELATALLFVASYIWWPVGLHGYQWGIFIWWLIVLVGLMALIVYDLRWYLLPNRIIYPLYLRAAIMAIISIVNADKVGKALLYEVLAVLVGGGIFYILFQISKGKWIGGGDVRLGFLLGLIASSPARSVLFIFAASFMGSAFSIPLLYSKKLNRSSVIPFGPFLIAGLIITQLFGHLIIHWYRYSFLKLN